MPSMESVKEERRDRVRWWLWMLSYVKSIHGIHYASPITALQELTGNGRHGFPECKDFTVMTSGHCLFFHLFLMSLLAETMANSEKEYGKEKTSTVHCHHMTI